MQKFNLPTNICKLCFKRITVQHIIDLFFSQRVICHGCYQQLEWHHEWFKFDKYDGESLFLYGDVFQARLRQYKTYYDLELAPTFLHYHRYYLKLKYYGYTIIPAPSHVDMIASRGFQHLHEIAKIIGLPIQDLFAKTTTVKQSQRPLNERSMIIQHLRLMPNAKIPKKLLLFDDVVTTGSTLSAMLHPLKQVPNIKIKILILAHTKDWKIDYIQPLK